MKCLNEPEIIGAIVGGLIGILGSAISYIIAYLIRISGKVSLFSNRSKVILLGKQDEYGQFGKVMKLENAEEIMINIDIDLFNSSDIPKIIGNFQIMLSNKNNEKIFSVHKTEWIANGVPTFESLNTIPIPPKQSTQIKCETHVFSNEFPVSQSKLEIFLLYKTLKKNFKKIKITEINKIR